MSSIHSILHISRFIGVATLIIFLLLISTVFAAKPNQQQQQASSSSKKGKQDSASGKEFPIRASEDLELNCPSLSYRFPQGTLQCESCRAVGVMLAYLVQYRTSGDIHEAIEAVCPALFEYAELRQAPTGLRYWDLSAVEDEDGRGDGLLPLSSNVDKVHPRGAPWPIVDADGKEPENPLQVTYHTPLERETLPCASYLLKQYCEEYLEAYEEMLEDTCFDEYHQALQKARSEEIQNKKLVSEGKQRNAKKRKTPSEVASEQLAHCLTVQQCDVRVPHCHSRMLAEKEEEERALFQKYSGRYGAKQFPYVKDRLSSKRFERNPYAKGGEKERDNELFDTPLEEL